MEQKEGPAESGQPKGSLQPFFSGGSPSPPCGRGAASPAAGHSVGGRPDFLFILAELPARRWRHGFAAAAGALYVFGGEGDAGQPLPLPPAAAAATTAATAAAWVAAAVTITTATASRASKNRTSVYIHTQCVYIICSLSPSLENLQ